MGRIMLAGVLGAVVYFIWGMAAWMAIPLHGPTVAGLPDEDAVSSLLMQQNLESGVYIVPWPAEDEDWEDPESAFAKRHGAGPLYTIFYHAGGMAPMAPSVLLGGFILDLLAATLAACLLSSSASGCCSTYARRVGFVLGLGIFVGIIGHGAYWNWMNFPLDYTLAFFVDVVVGWTLAGLVMAAIIRPVSKPMATEGNAAPTPE